MADYAAVRLAVVAVLGTTLLGCQVLRGLGRPAGSLGGKGIASIALELPKDTTLCPGFGVQLNVRARSHEGDMYNTSKETSWGNFDMAMQGGVVSTTGIARISGNPRVTWIRPATITATLLHNPRVQATLEIQSRYDCAYEAHFAQGRRKAFHIVGTVDRVGERDGKPVGRLILSAEGSRNRGVFYLTKGATVSIRTPKASAEGTPTVHIRVDPNALEFRDGINHFEENSKSPTPQGTVLRFSVDDLFLP